MGEPVSRSISQDSASAREPKAPFVLIVEDDPGIQEGLLRAVASRGYAGLGVASREEAAKILDERDAICVLLDMRLRDGDGLDLLRDVRRRGGGAPPVIVVTAFGDSERTIAAMKEGAFEYVTKPFDLPRLLDTVDRAVRTRAPATGGQVPAAPPGASSESLIGASACMLEVWKVIGRSAASQMSVLILGETGTGKELIARAVHAHSARAHGPVVSVNLAALPGALIESELFGHEKGAFTGAISRRPGRIELAAGGTLFLDEVGDLDLSLQTKLFRVLQDGRFERVGGAETLNSDVRIVAATNKPARPSDPNARLRSDLYYRLAVIEIEVPPLRARRSDIPLLVVAALKRTNARAVTEEAMARLVAYDWPGNVRELFHTVERAAIMAGSEVIDLTDLPPAIQDAHHQPAPGADACDGMTLHQAVRALEKQMIARALERAAGNRAQAARILGIARPQLYAKMAEHGMDTRRDRDQED